MAFTLPPLPYAASALEPVIDTETMELHHDKHHQSYVDNLNKAVDGDASLQNLTLDQLMARAGSLAPAVRNNGGGHWNHSLFWTLMARARQGRRAFECARQADRQRLRVAGPDEGEVQRGRARDASARAGRGWCGRAASCRSRARPTKIIR